MTFDQRLALARDLIARRDEIDAQLAALFEGALPSNRSNRKCKNCGEPGHRSDHCTQHQTTGDSSSASPPS